MKNTVVLVFIAIGLLSVKANLAQERFAGMVPNLGSMAPQIQPQGGQQENPVEKIETLEKQLEEDLKNPIELDAETDMKLDALLKSVANDPKGLDAIFKWAITGSLLPMINDQNLEQNIKEHKVEEEFQPLVQTKDAEKKKRELKAQIERGNKIIEGQSNIEELFTQVNQRMPKMDMPAIQDVDEFQPIEQFAPLHRKSPSTDDELARVESDIILIGNQPRQA